MEQGHRAGSGVALRVPHAPCRLFDSGTPLARCATGCDEALLGVLDAGASSSARRSRPSSRSSPRYLGAEHAVGVANGTEALTIALRALGVGPGDEVVVPSFTFYASAEAIPPTGATPVFCDVDPDDVSASRPRPCARR